MTRKLPLPHTATGSSTRGPRSCCSSTTTATVNSSCSARNSVTTPSSIPSRSNRELGRKYTFRCPVCQTDLTSTVNDNLVELDAETDDGRSERVGFSRVYGERATFVGSGPDHVTLYGDHATRYDSPNFFGAMRDNDDE